MFVFVAAEASGVIKVRPEGSPQDPPPSSAAREGAAAPGEAVHIAGALGVVAVGATGLIGLLVRPGRTGSSYHVLSAVAGLLVAVALVGNPDNQGAQAGVVDPAFVVLAVPALVTGLLTLRRPDEVDRRAARPLLWMGGLAALPLLLYGIDQGLMQRNTFPPIADPHHQAHWFAMSAFAFVVPLVVGTAGIGAAGWRVAAISASVVTIAVGLVSVAATEAASSLGRLGGAAALAWAIGVLLIAARERRERAVT